MPITIPEAIRQLLGIVDQLQITYPKKKFTLDGRLVGDIGEILVEANYDVKLFEEIQHRHDGTTTDGRLVQIKATMKDSLTFPADHVPQYYLGIKISSNGTFTEVFNGPGFIVREAIEHRKKPKTNLHSIRISTLVRLMRKVSAGDRVHSKQK